MWMKPDGEDAGRATSTPTDSALRLPATDQGRASIQDCQAPSKRSGSFGAGFPFLLTTPASRPRLPILLLKAPVSRPRWNQAKAPAVYLWQSAGRQRRLGGNRGPVQRRRPMTPTVLRATKLTLATRLRERTAAVSPNSGVRGATQSPDTGTTPIRSRRGAVGEAWIIPSSTPGWIPPPHRPEPCRLARAMRKATTRAPHSEPLTGMPHSAVSACRSRIAVFSAPAAVSGNCSPTDCVQMAGNLFRPADH